MTLDRDQLVGLLASFSRDQISRAGARYTPGVDPDAPNIAIEALITDLSHLACGPEVQSRCTESAENIEGRWKTARSAFENAEPTDQPVAHLVTLLRDVPARIRGGELGLRDEIVASLKTISTAVGSEETRLENLEREAAERARASAAAGAAQAAAVSTQTNSIRSHLHELRRMAQEVNELERHFAGSPGALLVKRLCLLSGQWGTGKTHFLCDFAKHRLEQGRPVLLLLAKTFQGTRGILNTLAAATRIAGSVEELLDHLEELGKALEERVLVIIDGINEGPRAPWRAAVDELTGLLAPRRHLALVVSCRSPFEHHALSAAVLPQMEKIIHRGFDEQEFDAQAEFFRYYKVPLPEVPLLDDEFSRPLTLKLICESFRGLGTKKLKEGFHGVASGQKGMTYVLESFVNRIAEPIEKRHRLPRKACWELLKGRRGIADPRAAGLAGHMAVTLREYVGRRAAHRIVRAHFPALSARRRRQLLEDMRISGLLDEDYIWNSRGGTPKNISVFRLPYQRFSDHLIARHLLEKHLDKSSEDALRKSFVPRKPLGRVFGKKRHHYDYARPGWAEALIVEFPEAVKRIAQTERELYFFLPKRARNLNYYYKPLVQGLFWRAPTSFSRGTDRVVGVLLDRGNERAWRETVDALVAISIKPGHPYSAKRLYGYLSRYSMVVRDRTWSEYIRQHYESPSVMRLLTWVARARNISLPAYIAEQVIVLLSLVLTTVARRDRDVATRALVELGERHPRTLFAHTAKALEFNDPYVPERMLAASYGVAMSKHATSAGARFRNALCKLARALYEKMFAPDAPYATHHTLRRDYALGVIRLALSIRSSLLSAAERAHLEKPFSQIPSRFPEPADITDEQVAEVERTIHMDFGNYTMGRLIPNRRNYDHENVEYKKVRRQIEWCIWDLGYRKADFESIDRQIAGLSQYAEQRNEPRTDRYGKKYSWIAFFEMYGLREARGLLAEDRLLERTSDCDIDPSFPKPPPRWAPPLPSVFGDISTTSTAWVTGGFTPDFQPVLRVPSINGKTGPWVLLQGFVQRQDKTLDREIFTFLRGLFVRRKEVPTLREKFLQIEYPGNTEIPDGPSDYYLFAGEAGTSPRFAPELRTADGRYRRYVGEAFSATEHIPPPAGSQPKKPAKRLVIRIERSVVSPAQEDQSPSEDKLTEIEFFPPNPGEWRRIPGVRVELPYRQFSWESYHSAMNSFSGFRIPAASIIGALKLCTWDREIDFREASGQLATLYREEEGEDWDGDTHNLLYVREDLLSRYLSKTRQTLVWCNWGERGWADKGDLHSYPTPERSAIFQSHAHIHRRFHEYDLLRKGE